MFNNLHVKHNVKFLTRRNQLFCRYKLIVNGQSLLDGMVLGDADIAFNNIYPINLGTSSRQSLT